MVAYIPEIDYPRDYAKEEINGGTFKLLRK